MTTKSFYLKLFDSPALTQGPHTPYAYTAARFVEIFRRLNQGLAGLNLSAEVIDDLTDARALAEAITEHSATRRLTPDAMSEVEARRLNAGDVVTNRHNNKALKFIDLSPDGTVHAVDIAANEATAVDYHELRAAS